MDLQCIMDQFPDCEFLKADGFDEAVIGVEESSMRLIYSVSKCLEILERELSPEDAQDHYYFNIECAYVGEKTPIWCYDLEF